MDIDRLVDGIGALESLGGCEICFHDCANSMGRELREALPLTHSTPFCSLAKATGNGNGLRLCTGCDQAAVHRECARRKSPFIKICGFRAMEVVVPVFSGGNLAAVMFMGLFKPAGFNDSAELVHPPVTAEFDSAEVNRARLKLPEITPEKAAQLAAVGQTMAWLLSILLDREWQEPIGNSDKKNMILRFVHKNYRNSKIGVNDLAERLKLSESRSGHLVKQHFNQTFPELLNDRRLRAAERLLAETMFHTGDIAALCGFSSSQYFYRRFKNKHQLTPSQYRLLNARPGSQQI